ncbi:response regulator [Noviherbaspirillum suwonense]|jgi:two-component system KDP operon response regulator KdpE|uniref:Two component transcriptional regulator, winged helix family n=1 Tax=Noviherbaspirillum suwonense TaxID=1224511 RepID=A0ABY1QA11_9BURK|nr:response regulator [Noviherbaspirillum suwonense]SMP65120.1 two component transcriptional regulator, winged helix family [Noviherbaspirillum suwonense]
MNLPDADSAPPAHILLIEDERQIRRFVRLTLQAAQMRVSEAETGREGLALARRQPDLILLDLGLPDMDGVDLIRQLRSWSTVPVIVLSARSAEAKKVEALDAGADDYLTKPFGNPELLARIRVHLRKRHAPVGADLPVLAFGAVVVDLAQRSVTRDGQPLHLTPIEFRLLATLARHAGRVLTHTQLLREVWGPGHAERSHYLRVYMGHLRQKIEADPARPVHIITETGVGYRLMTG